MRPGCKTCRLPVAILLAWLSGIGSVWAQDPPARVLVLYSTRRDAQISVVGERELPRVIEAGLGRDLDYYSEYIDRGRFPDPLYKEAFRDFLRSKYQGLRFDVIIAMHRLAYETVSSARDEVFPGTPIVYLNRDRSTGRGGNTAEIITEVDYARTLALALRLQPDTTQVFVVAGSSDRDAAMVRAARHQFSTRGSSLAFTYLTNLSTEDLERRLAALPEHAIVYYLIFYQDVNGTNVTPLDYLSRLTAISNRPVYSWVDSTMDHGVVGGSLMSIEQQIRAVATVGLRVLRGEAAGGIPASVLDLQVDQVDWRQLRRWHIAEEHVPAGTAVKFRELSLWERDRNYVLGALAVIVTETALLVGLIVQAARRRRAEAAAEGAAAALRASFDRIRDLGARLLGAQEEERSRIARELHDDISQQLTLLSIELDLLARTHPDRGDEAQALSRTARTRVQEIAGSVRQLSHELHPAKLRIIGLVAALGALQKEGQAAGHNVTFGHEQVPAVLPQDVMLCFYRIAQEGLQNAIKHSGAGAIAMSLIGDGPALTLTIADDGAGFDVGSAVARGLGLISMEERLEPFGGTLRIDSAPGWGTRLEATVNVRQAMARTAETA